MKPRKEDHSRRRLAAIMFSDIVGYTAMMQENEENGLRRVQRFSRVLEAQAAEHNGEVLDVRGDGSLTVFPSAVNALECAYAMQREFQVEPQVPLRIGIHVGDIVEREGSIYGDGVNLASRVESIALAGSVLLTEQVIPYLQNHPGFQLSSLGKVRFKNVQQPLEVFALANEGLRVPRRNQLRGKLERKRRIWPMVIIGLLVLLLGGMFWWQPSGLLDRAAIPDDLKEERVAVMAFENQTADPELDAFGQMISDWLSKGFLETGATQVVNATNIQRQVAAAGVSDLDRPEQAVQLGQTLGLGVVIGGSYYLLEDSLFVTARILNTNDGTYLKVIDLHAHRDQSLSLLEELSQQVLGFWAVKGRVRFQQNPPKIEAYRDYVLGKQFYVSDPQQSEQLLRRAFRRDSSFFEPIFTLYGLYVKEGKDSMSALLLDYLESRKSTFTNWEQVNLQEIMARERRDWLEAAQMAEKQFRMDPSDLYAHARAIVHYNRGNYPRKALELLGAVDERFRDREQVAEINWTAVDEIFAHFRSGDYDRVIELAEAYALPKTPDALAVMHLKALVRSGRLEGLDGQLEDYLTEGVYSTSGKETPAGQIQVLLCDALWLYGDEASKLRFVDRLMNWTAEHADDPAYPQYRGYGHFYRQEYDRALTHWEQEERLELAIPGWQRSVLEIEHLSRLGYCYAALGDTSLAVETIRIIMEKENGHADLPAVQHYYRARILAGLERKAEAVAALEESMRFGFSFYRPAVFDSDPFLVKLQHYPPFTELIAARR